MMKRGICTVILLLIIPLMSGCSIMGSYYLRNYLNEAVQLILVRSESPVPLEEKAFVFKYEDRIQKLQFYTFKQLTKELKAQKLDNYRVSLTVPAQSTVWMGIGLNTNSWNFAQARLVYGGQERSIDLNNPSEVTFKRSGIGHYVGYYNIK